MMLPGFFFLLLLTGGQTSSLEQPELQGDQQASNQSFMEMPVGNTSISEQQELHDDQQASSQSFMEMPGGNTPSSEPPKLLDKKSVSSDNTKKGVNLVDVNCSYQALLKYLNLTKNNELYTLSRPVKVPNRHTSVKLKMVLYAILDVRETDQTFIPYVWIYMGWMNDHIQWEPSEFCNLKHIIVPTELLWKPDLTIEEMTERDKAPPSPYLTINYDGEVELRNDQVLISTCRMQVYKFPFDTQRCNLSFKSIVYSQEEVKFNAILSFSKITEWSLQVMGKHYEWVLINVTADHKTVNNFGFNQSMIVYTISMKRRSALYIVNFILPILFLLSLDWASFLISDSGGEKLSFKITVLLAVTVMQLILNEILPSSSDRIPLIAVYCTGIFALMLLSLLETIVVMHLLGKDSATQDNEADKDQSLKMKKRTCCECACDAGDTPTEMLPDKEVGSSSTKLTEASCGLENVSDDLREMEKTITLMRNSSGKEERKPSYWTRVTKRINKTFFICYFTATILFLIVIFSLWIIAEDN